MCGIVGVIDRNHLEDILQMNQAQYHRGPDGGGVFHSRDAFLSLAMRRLAILDLQDGNQPMSNHDESLVLVYNGEIFNSPELREELKECGAQFKTHHSDTEVILNGYQIWGKDIVKKLNGMFAFCIFDKNRNILFGARDQLGIKPFHYSLKGNSFAFASEEKSLRKLSWISQDLDHSSISHFFSFQCIPSPQSIFQDIKKLPAGHAFTLSLRDKRMEVFPYWQLAWGTQDGSKVSYREGLERLRSTFYDGVKRWCLSDVPVALSLSGGIDSTLVGAAMIHAGLKNISTYSLGFTDAPDLDERNLAQETARIWETQHHEIILESRDLLSTFPSMIESLDVPYAGGLPSWFIYKEVAKKFKVVMTGSGGDELFGNYSKWKIHKNWWAGLKRRARLLIFNGTDPLDFFKFPFGSIHYPYFSDRDKMKHLLLDARKSSSSSQLLEGYRELMRRQGLSQDEFSDVTLMDISLQLPEEFLMMTDRFSMAHSLEARVPFLDRKLVELVASFPGEYRCQNQRAKGMLLDAFREEIPTHLLGQKKRGFQIPISTWLREDLRPIVEKLLAPTYLKKQGIFQSDIYNRYALKEFSGKSTDSYALWEILCFQLWYEAIIKKNTLELI